MTSGLRIIVTGLVAQYPLGGVTWDYLQYVLGLSRMGHDVYYLEDTGQWPYNPLEGGLAKGCSYNVDYLAAVMDRVGLGDHWMYRFPWESQWFGISGKRRDEVFRTTDLLINVSGTLDNPAEYRSVRRMAYIDSDPGFTQVKLARGQVDFQRIVDIHDIQFSFGECLSDKVPDTGHTWRPTRQPIVLSEWHPSAPHRETYTTVMNWTSYKSVSFNGRKYGQKDIEFERFMDLPSSVPDTQLEIAVNAGKTHCTPRDRLVHNGWRVVEPDEVCPDLESYRSYIESSKAEWSTAKNGYIVGQTGWFSCRSACYLAAGRPVIVQDTGFSKVIPVGEGILTFSSMDEAIEAINRLETDYPHHALAAREIAEQYFDSDQVLGHLIDEAMADSADDVGGRISR
jgi:hypothetical protein